MALIRTLTFSCLYFDNYTIRGRRGEPLGGLQLTGSTGSHVASYELIPTRQDHPLKGRGCTVVCVEGYQLKHEYPLLSIRREPRLLTHTIT